MVVAAAFAATATAGLSPAGSSSAKKSGELKAYVQDSLLSAIQQNPKQAFDVIVQGTDRKGRSSGFVQKLLSDSSGSSDERVSAGDVKKQFLSINGAQLTLTGKQILRLAKNGIAGSIAPNETVKSSGPRAEQLSTYSSQLWSWSVLAPVDWLSGTPKAPTIAVVDSGIDPGHAADFGSRLIGSVNMSTLQPNSAGDGYGHGTFVAGIAAGAAKGYAGTAPTANLLSIDVMNDHGQATVSDVVAAADWILKNKSAYNIRVANFSLHSVNRASVFFDPLDQAVERLWLNGVVVVAASGNYGDTTPGVQFAPGNDPFVITVGAADTMGTMAQADDTAAPWSAAGYTPDGFMKPEVSAPGRYMIGPVTANGGLALERPDKVVAPGYMQLSGTSFAAPVVSAIAAMLIAQHPGWSPDTVKGAIMLTAQKTADPARLGVGEANVYFARAYSKSTAPNPNAALKPFIVDSLDGTKVFDAAAWQSAAKSSAAWADAAWADAAWSSAAWSSAAWSSAAWADAAWASAAWADAAWSDAAWADAAWSDAAWADGTDGEPEGDTPVTEPSTQENALDDLGIVDPACDPLVSLCSAVGSLLP